MSNDNGTSRPWVSSLKGAAIYALFGLLWIYFSDTILGTLVTNPERLTVLQTYKGCFYIVITAILVFWLLLRHGRTVEKSHMERIKNERSLQLFFQALPVGVGAAKGRIVEMVNERFCEITGYSMDEIVGQNSRMFYADAEEYERVGKVLYENGALREQCFVDTRWRHKDGRLFDVLLGAAMAEEGAEPTDVVLSVMDITDDRKREELYMLLFERAYDAIFLMNNRTFLDCNARTLEMYGATREALVGASPLEFSPEKQPDGEDSALAAPRRIAAALAGEPQIFEWLHHRGDGTLFNAEISLNRVDLEGEARLLAIVRDITKKKQDDAARHKNEQITKALYGITSAVSATNDMNELYATIHETLLRRIDATNFYVAVIDDPSDSISFPIFADEHDKPYVLEHISDPETTSMTLAVIRSGKPLLVGERADDDIVPFEDFGLNNIVGTRPAVWLGVPLCVRGKIIGAMAVQHYSDPYKYGPNDTSWLLAVSEQVALAIDRKQTLEALKKSEDSLSSLFRAVPTGIGVIQNRVLVTVNDQFCEIFGYPREELLGQGTRRLYFSEEEFQACGKDIYDQLETRGISAVEAHMVRKDGQEIYVLIRSTLLPDVDGSVTVTSSVLDITERKRALEALQRKDEYLTSIFRAAPVGIAVLENRVMIEVNDRFCEMLGYDREELIGQTTRMIYPSQDEFERCGREIYDSMANQQFCAVEGDFLRKDGQEIAVLINGSPRALFGAGNAVTFSVLDITESKQTLKALQENEEYLTSIFRCTPTGIGVIRNRVVMTANDRFCEIIGYPREEIVGQEVRKFYATEEEYQRCGRELHDAMDKYGYASVETLGRRKDGQVIHLLVNTAPLPAEAGDRVNSLSMMDITERKKNEEALKRYKDELEGMVKERTEELTDSNAELQRMIDASEDRSRQTAILNEMGELLQACETEEETYRVAVGVCAKLFPRDSGCLGILDGDNWSVNVVGSWGDGHSCNPEFDHSDCWAIRRGKAHMVSEPETDPLCMHVRKEPACGTLCVPMNAQGKVLGMAHMLFDSAMQEFKEPERRRTIQEKRLLLSGLVERYAPSLVNLRLRESLREQSIRDRLTGLFNRRHMEEALNRELARARRRGSSLVLVMIDVDHFKRFNDTYGHETGDEVLRRLGEFLTSTVRKEDIPCRYGGEELMLILPECTMDDGLTRAEDVRKGIEEDVMVVHDGKRLQVTASLGIASFPLDGEDMESLVAAADKALYCAKEGGRNQVVAHK